VSDFSDVTVLVHVGLHKTGTTWLQERLFQRYAGSAFAYSEDRRLIRGNFRVLAETEFDAEIVREEFRPLLAEAQAMGRPLILSDEILTGLPFHDRFARLITIDRLKRVFPRARILVTIREQIDIIVSSYGHYVRGGYSGGFEDFIARPGLEKNRLFWPILEYEHFDYFHLYEFLAGKFGHDSIMVTPMEWMMRNPDAFAAELARFAGCEAVPLAEGQSDRTVNPAWSQIGYEVARHLNHLVPQDARWRRKAPISASSAAWWVDRFTPGSMRRRMKARRIDRARAAVGDLYCASNRRLEQRLGLDLGGLGYMT
jgi:hypothetical protein